MIGIDLEGTAPWALWLAYFSAIPAVWLCAHVTITRVFGRPGVEILSLLLAVHLPVMMATSVVLFEWVRRRQGEASAPGKVVRDFAANLFSNPLVVGILAGVLWRVAELPMPSLGARFIDSFAGIAGTVALFSMGLGLRKFGISGNVKPALALSAMKLLLLPALVLATSYLAGLPPLVAQVMVVAAAMPTGVNPYLIAMRFGSGQVLASNTTTISTAFAVLTTGFWLAVAQRVFG